MTSLEVTLTCGDCGARRILRPRFRLTKMTVLRLEGGTGGWYVDGDSVFCDGCVGDRDLRPQRETWGEWDRRCVEQDQEHEADLDDLIQRNPGVVARVLDTRETTP